MGGGMMKKPMGYTTGDLARDRVLARLKKERDSFKLIKNPARIDQIQKEINELELQKKVDRDATIKKARASIDKIKSKEKDRLTERDMELLRQQAQRLRVNQLKAQGKMGGGMMKKPMGYKKGSKKEMEIKKFVKKHGTFPYVKPKKKMGGGMMMQKPMAYYGGGMMMRPNPIGMKSGKSVKVKCKLGRNKPTKMY
jgi:CubicO group peptidase (beta-lactamase class C family)